MDKALLTGEVDEDNVVTCVKFAMSTGAGCLLTKNGPWTSAFNPTILPGVAKLNLSMRITPKEKNIMIYFLCN